MAETEALFVQQIPVRFQDVDAAGVVFFARMFDYAHDAFIAYMQQVGLPIDKLLNDGQFALPLVHVEADYRQPLRFGDMLQVLLIQISAGERSLQFDYVLQVADKVCAKIQLKHAVIDPAQRRTVPLPAHFRQHLGLAAAQEGGRGAG